jgi:hypothetical protein
VKRLRLVGSSKKYGNRKTEVDGLLFDSAWEAEVYRMLKLRAYVGEIRDLQRQVTFVLLPGFRDKWKKWHKPIEYRADFTFFEGDQYTVVEPKGVLTDDFRIKEKLFRFQYPDIRLEIMKKPKERRR